MNFKQSLFLCLTAFSPVPKPRLVAARFRRNATRA